jgi:hypothetical protein
LVAGAGHFLEQSVVLAIIYAELAGSILVLNPPFEQPRFAADCTSRPQS